MWQGIVYLRSQGRRPVDLGVRYGLMDVQAMLPVGWCESCGTEVFRKDRRICSRCIRAKGAMEDGSKEL